MKNYIISYKQTATPGTLLWRCRADDFPHAVEQLKTALADEKATLLDIVDAHREGRDVADRMFWKCDLLMTRYGALQQLATIAVLKLVSVWHTRDRLWEAFRNAVSDWVVDTKLGRKAWEESCEDLNIGDLMLHDAFEDAEFGRILHRHGILLAAAAVVPRDGEAPFDSTLVSKAAKEKLTKKTDGNN
jgi:hypothetical protein